METFALVKCDRLLSFYSSNVFQQELYDSVKRPTRRF